MRRTSRRLLSWRTACNVVCTCISVMANGLALVLHVKSLGLGGCLNFNLPYCWQRYTRAILFPKVDFAPRAVDHVQTLMYDSFRYASGNENGDLIISAMQAQQRAY